MLRWYPSVLLRVVLVITFLPLMFFTIFAVNCISDPGTPWSAGAWHGPGTSGDFFKVAGILVVGWVTLVLGWRGGGALFKWLIVLWHAGLIAACGALLTETGGLVVHGESIGLTLSLELLGPALSAIALVCSLSWIVIDARSGRKERSVSPLQRRNKVAALIAGVLLPAAGVAFALDIEEAGAVVCALALIACHETIRPLNPSEELHKALVVEGSAPR